MADNPQTPAVQGLDRGALAMALAENDPDPCDLIEYDAAAYYRDFADALIASGHRVLPPAADRGGNRTQDRGTCEKGAPEPGQAYYVRWGWSGSAGSAWQTLPAAVKVGWRHAEEAQARATALSQKIDRCTARLRAALGYAADDRDAGLESLAVQVERSRAVPPAEGSSR